MHPSILALAILFAPSAEQALASQFDNACSAFDQGNWEAAATGFAALRASGLPSGWLAYNLGNSQLRAGRLGEAIASYRQALVDLPRHSDIRANLAFARKRVQDAVAPIEPDPLTRSLFLWHYVLNGREQLWIFGSCMALFWVCRVGLVLGFLPRLFAVISALAALGSLALGGSLAVHLAYPVALGVVVADEVEVHMTNQPQAPVRFRLHAGCEAAVHGQLDGWVLVALSDGKQGWVPRQSVALVAL